MSFGDWINLNGDPSATRSFFGVVPAYPIFMFSGIILTIIISIIQLKRKKIPLKDFETSIFFIVPIGVIGASIFGKIFIPGLTWYHIFFFWEPGMSLFGALALGIVAGFVWFYARSKKSYISVWVYADCIIPNILIGQALGRWGNLYNHEILGNLVSQDSLNWLIPSIKDRLFYFPDLSGYELASLDYSYLQEHLQDVANWGPFKGIRLADVLNSMANPYDSSSWLTNSEGRLLDPAIFNYGNINLLYRSPLFLYESISNLILWALITFIITNLGRWFSKPKPWDLTPKAYPGWYNKDFKSLPESEIINVNTQLPIKYRQVEVKIDNQTSIQLKLGFYQAWNKAYYYYVPDSSEIRTIEEKTTEYYNVLATNLDKIKQVKTDYQKDLKQTKSKYQQKIKVAKKDEFYKLLNQKKQDIDLIKNNYKNKKENIYQIIGKWNRIFADKPQAKKLEKLHNPNNYFIIRSGVITGSYFLGYMIIRIGLETQRRFEELFIQNAVVVDFIVLSLILLTGLAIIYITQFISPYKYREVGWLYEKSY